MKLRQLLYLVDAGGLYKIGISQDINKRLKSLQTGSPHTVRCVAYYHTDESAMTIERKLHKLFDKYRLSGEWFNFEDKFTQEAFDTLCPRYGMTRLDFNEDGSCKTLQEEVKKEKRRTFGDIPEHEIPPNAPEKDIYYWRRRYGIKGKGY